jgi:hypothetical protein
MADANPGTKIRNIKKYRNYIYHHSKLGSGAGERNQLVMVVVGGKINCSA